MPEAFDIGPLSWVKDEIDQALNSVLGNLDALSINHDDVGLMRFSQTYLYQVSGALDMVGLEGCKRYSSELEKLASKLEKKLIPVSDELIVAFRSAVQTLAGYLQDLMGGMPDIPTKLYASLLPIVEAQGELIEESELFFPDTSFAAPKNVATKVLEGDDVHGFVTTQRLTFQQALLSWLKSPNEDAMDKMREAVDNIAQTQTQSTQKTLWWSAAAFIDALRQPGVASKVGAKRLCRRLDQQMRSLGESGSRAFGNLLRDILYYVAISKSETPRIDEVKQLFELDALLPSAGADVIINREISSEEADAAGRVKGLVDTLKEHWSAYSEGKADALSAFLQQYVELAKLSGSIHEAALVDVLSNVQTAATTMELDAKKATDASMMEVAVGLNLLEDAFAHYKPLDGETVQTLSKQSKRVLASVGLASLDESDQGASQSDKALLQAIAQQIKASLKVVEESLDAYFRNQENAMILDIVYRPLQQIASAFDMLEMRTPAAIAETNARVIKYFRRDGVNQESQYYEIVAESLSMLGFYADELPRVRPESELVLVSTLVKLEDALKQLSGDIAPANTTANAPSEGDGVAEHVAVVTDKPADQELLDIYLAESEEVLANIASHLQALKVNATDAEALTEVRRGFHTLKGSGRTVGLSALGEVAWSVENLLNGVIEKKEPLTLARLNFVEKTAAAFAEWTSELRNGGEVLLDPSVWLQEAAKLEKLAAAKPKKVAEEVLIGGTRKMSRALFDIFINEAKQHTQTLTKFTQSLKPDQAVVLSDELRRAAHTLGSNALTAGFKPMGELARALERWLDVHHGMWTEQTLALYKNTADKLASMLATAAQKRNLRASRALIAALDKATALASEPASENVSQLSTPEPVLAETDVAPAPQAQATELTQQASPVEKPGPKPASKAKQSAQRELTVAEQEVLTMFVEEARELLPQIGKEMRGWQAQPDEVEHSDTLQRALHTLKGSARMAGQSVLADTVHGMEDRVIRALKNKVTATDFEGMFAEFDKIGSIYEDLIATGSGDEATQATEGEVQPTQVRAVEKAPTRASDRKAQYLRLRTDVLERLINDAGEISITRSRMEREMQNVKGSSQDLTESVMRLRAYLRELEIEAETQMQSRMTSLQEANEAFDPLEFDRYTRLQELTRMMAESVNDVSTIQHNMLNNLDQTDAALQQQSRMNRELQQSLLGVRLLPFATLSERFQRIVRQTSRELKKAVNLVIEGEDVEIDRSVLEKMVAPIEHLLRNAVAHGLEGTADRQASGKPASGSVNLKVRQENEEIVLTVSDDGAGINLAKVREKAIQNHMLEADQDVSEQALLSVIFEPGFSTATDVSQIAGRGVGLDVVRSDISELGGRIDVNNTQGQGATFTIFLPMTQSVSQVVVVRSGGHVFAVPAVMVEQVQKLKAQDLAAGYEAANITWNDAAYSLHYLARLVGDIEHKPEEHKYTPVLLLRSANYRIALHVDEVVGNQEVVMKPIGPQLARVPGMVGATVTGDGGIILLINPVQLANRETLTVGSIKVNTVAPAVMPVTTRNTIMVVDDSLTMRKVLGRLLEREGFEVITAKDGMDALQMLQEVTPDVILTDIEMPRMDGFELTRNIKDDVRLRAIPLAMISSRTAEKHQNYARELGVNAFLGKPAHDDDVLNVVNGFLQK